MEKIGDPDRKKFGSGFAGLGKNMCSQDISSKKGGALCFKICRLLVSCLFAGLITGCSPDRPEENPQYTEHLQSGTAMWTDAQPLIETDPRAALPALLQARENFLLAAMTRPGDQPAARQIAGVSAQIRLIEQQIQKQEEAEEGLQEKLRAAIEKLQELTRQENSLADQSRQLLRKRPPAPAEEKTAAAEKILPQQTDINTGTAEVQQMVQEVQQVVQKMLAAAYGENEAPPPTEFDAAIEHLKQARSAQDSAAASLQPETLQWPNASSSLMIAGRKMQEALQQLSDQNANQNTEPSSDENDFSDWEFDEDMEWSESDLSSDMSMPMSSQNFKTALESRALPVPNYTAEEVLAEEAANQEQRAQKKAERAGAGVEKNW